MKSPFFVRLVACVALGVGVQSAHAGNATWDLNPSTNLWNTPENWTPATVPNGPSDTATFAVSNLTGVAVSATTEVNQIIFGSGASAFTITVNSPAVLTIDAGVINNSGISQSFVVGPHASLSLGGQVGAQDPVTYEVQGSDSSGVPGYMILRDANAGNATYMLDGGASTGAFGGYCQFFGSSTGDACTFVVNGGAVLSAGGGYLEFGGDGIYPSAGNGNYTINGGAARSAQGGFADVLYGTTLQTATFTVNGGAAAGALGGGLLVDSGTTADQATLIANGAVAGASGGTIFFGHDALGATSRVELFGRGNLDISLHAAPGLTIGSLEGNGAVYLGSNNLAVGSSNLSTTFSGVIHPGSSTGMGDGTGSLTKIGTGTLTLTGANLYTAGTTVSAGTLAVANQRGSGTGTGPVSVNAGTLGGQGIIAGAVTVGSGVGRNGTLAPALAGKRQNTLTIQGSLTMNTGSSYRHTFRATPTKIASDTTQTNGVVIQSGANISFIGNSSGFLTPGSVMTVISNTAATPIAGTFVNLPDGITVTINGYNFKASYEGGDGNDLVLIVVP